MKNINVTFDEDKRFERLIKLKNQSKLSWGEFILVNCVNNHMNTRRESEKW